MTRNGVWEVVNQQDVPKDADIINSTWVMKKKANGEYQAHKAAHAIKQTQGKSFVHHNIPFPVTHDITVQIVLAIMLMGSMCAHLDDVNGLFLGEFKPEERISMKIPCGFKKYFPLGVLLFLKHTLYGLKNGAKPFWKLLLGIMNELGYTWNRVDPCLYYKWDPMIGMIVWLSFLNDMLIVCKEEWMSMVKEQFTETVNCDNIGPMKECIGTKIDVNHATRSLKITQPILVKSLIDEFTFDEPNAKLEVPATGGTHLMSKGPSLCMETQMRYCSGVGKLLYLVKWSHPEIVNSMCELTQFMIKVFPASVKGMKHIMQHVLTYPECGMVMQLDGEWDGSKEFEFEIDRISDSGDVKLHKCFGGLQVFVNKAPIAHKSKMQPSFSLSMAKGELITAVEAAQIMLLAMHVMEVIRWNDKAHVSASMFPA